MFPLRIIRKVSFSAWSAKRILSTASHPENIMKMNPSVPGTLELTDNLTEMTLNLPQVNGFLNTLKEVSKDRTETNVEVIITDLMTKFRENRLHITPKYADELLHHEHCRYVFNVILNNIKDLTARQTIDTLIFLKKCHAPQKSIIVQKTLAVLQKRMNDLYIHEIITIAKLLHNYDNTPLAKGLKSGLELVLETKIRTEMDGSNLDEVTHVFKNLALFGWTTSIAAMIDLIHMKLNDITSKTALRIHFGLCRMETTTRKGRKLLRRAEEAIKAEEDLLTNRNIIEILGSIKCGMKLGNELYYKPQLVESWCYLVVNRQPPIHELMTFTFMVGQLNHASTYLSNHLAAYWKTNKDPEFGTMPMSQCVLHSVNYFATGCYKPANLKNIERVIKKDLLQDLSTLNLLTCTLSLLAIDCFIPELIEKVLKMKVATEQEKLLVLDIYRIVKTLYPEASVEAAPHTLAKIKKLVESDPLIYQFKLQACLRGSEFIKNGLKTKLGHCIDHGLLFSEYGNFIPFEEETGVKEAKFVNDLNIPSKHHLILVQIMPDHAYQAGRSYLTGIYYMKALCLQKHTGHPLLVLSKRSLINLSCDKLEEFMREEIKRHKTRDFVTFLDLQGEFDWKLKG